MKRGGNRQGRYLPHIFFFTLFICKRRRLYYDLHAYLSLATTRTLQKTALSSGAVRKIYIIVPLCYNTIIYFRILIRLLDICSRVRSPECSHGIIIALYRYLLYGVIQQVRLYIYLPRPLSAPSFPTCTQRIPCNSAGHGIHIL